MEIAIEHRLPLQWQPMRFIDKLFLIPLIYITSTHGSMRQNKNNPLPVTVGYVSYANTVDGCGCEWNHSGIKEFITCFRSIA
jgi:hypothetical protein